MLIIIINFIMIMIMIMIMMMMIIIISSSSSIVNFRMLNSPIHHPRIYAGTFPEETPS